MKVLLRILCFAAGLAAASTATAQEWTRFRGPNGTGLSDAGGIPVAWGDDDYLWRITLPGEGHASPVLWGNVIFTTCAEAETGERSLLAVDAGGGEILWRRPLGGAPYQLHQFSSFASGTPAVDAERVYIAFATPQSLVLSAVDHDGEEVWTKELGPYASMHGFGSSPMRYRDLVILANDQWNGSNPPGESFLVALDASTGEIRWSTPRKSREAAYSTPFVFTAADGSEQLVFSSGAEGLVGVDGATGDRLWGLEVFDKRSVSCPFTAAGLIFGTCGSGGGGNYVAAVAPPAPGSQVEAQLAYRVTSSAPYVPSSVVVDGLVFLVSDKGVATCLRPADGSVVWRERLAPGEFFSSPVCVGDRIYAISTTGEVVAFAASEQFEVLGRSELNDECHGTPAAVEGKMILRTKTQLMAVGEGIRQ